MTEKLNYINNELYTIIGCCKSAEIDEIEEYKKYNIIQIKVLLMEMLIDLKEFSENNFRIRFNLEIMLNKLYVIYRFIDFSDLKSMIYQLILDVYDLKNSKEVE